MFFWNWSLKKLFKISQTFAGRGINIKGPDGIWASLWEDNVSHMHEENIIIIIIIYYFIIYYFYYYYYMQKV